MIDHITLSFVYISFIYWIFPIRADTHFLTHAISSPVCRLPVFYCIKKGTPFYPGSVPFFTFIIPLYLFYLFSNTL